MINLNGFVFYLMLIVFYLMLIVCSLVLQTGKQQFHCDDCGICRYINFTWVNSSLCYPNLWDAANFGCVIWSGNRVGGSENYFHCQKCGMHSSHGFHFVDIVDSLSYWDRSIKTLLRIEFNNSIDCLISFYVLVSY